MVRNGVPSVIAKGPLPGLIQTAFRAELYSVVTALELAAVNGACLWIRSDNLAVVKGVSRLEKGGRVKINALNSDLWARCRYVLQQGHAKVKIEHIRAHQDPLSSCHAKWNQLADHTAVLANRDRPCEFWDVLARHSGATHRIRIVCRAIQEVQLRISRKVFETKPIVEAETTFGPCQVEVPSAQDWVFEDDLPMGVIAQYGSVFIAHVRRWLEQVKAELSDLSEQPRWVASHQLYVDFQKSTGHHGPIFKNGRWQMHQQSKVAPVNFKVRCRWFIKVVSDIFHHWGNELVRNYTKPDSTMLLLHTGCIVVRWPQRRLDLIDEWFASVLRSPATRNGTALESLPHAMRDFRMVA